jgi:hypothetical protein
MQTAALQTLRPPRLRLAAAGSQQAPGKHKRKRSNMAQQHPTEGRNRVSFTQAEARLHMTARRVRWQLMLVLRRPADSCSWPTFLM